MSHSLALLYNRSVHIWAVGCHCAVLQQCSLVVQGLRAHGHLVNLGRWSAVTQAIVIDPDHATLVGASDPRKDGAPAGY